MKWKWFWISVAVLLGSWKVKSNTNFAGITLISPLKEILFVLFIISFIFCAYFLLDKLGIITYSKVQT